MVRTADLPDLGIVTDTSLFVADRSGSGAFRATALRDYVASTVDDAEAAAEAAAAANTGRNRLHNARFNIWQRGNGPFTTGYTADRWQLGATNTDNSVTLVAASDADRTGIGDEAVQYLLQDTLTGTGTAGAYSYICQPVEYVQRLSGKTVTLSFWARATSGTPKLGVNALQNFGTGGTPSTPSWALSTGIAVTLSTTWTRYTATIALPSAIGKTLGSNKDDATTIALFTSTGSAGSAISGNIGVQSFTFQLWGVQLEIGSAATDLEQIAPQIDLANCQRYYQILIIYGTSYQTTATASFGMGAPFAVQMRATPTLAIGVNSSTNLNTVSVSALTSPGGQAIGAQASGIVTTGSLQTTLSVFLVASAEL